jgi:hypothetical protein
VIAARVFAGRGSRNCQETGPAAGFVGNGRNVAGGVGLRGMGIAKLGVSNIRPCWRSLMRAFLGANSYPTTLNACQAENVAQVRQAKQTIYRPYGAGYHHCYGREWQLLDVDLSSLPAGRQSEGVGFMPCLHFDRRRTQQPAV